MKDFKQAFKESCEAYDSQEDMLSTVPYRMGSFEPMTRKAMDNECKKQFGRSFDQMWQFCKKGAESKDREMLRSAAAKGSKGALEMIADRSRMRSGEDSGVSIQMSIPKEGEYKEEIPSSPVDDKAK